MSVFEAESDSGTEFELGNRTFLTTHSGLRVQVRILHHESQPHRLAGQSADIGAGFPGDGSLNGIPKEGRAIRYRQFQAAHDRTWFSGGKPSAIVGISIANGSGTMASWFFRLKLQVENQHEWSIDAVRATLHRIDPFPILLILILLKDLQLGRKFDSSVFRQPTQNFSKIVLSMFTSLVCRFAIPHDSQV